MITSNIVAHKLNFSNSYSNSRSLGPVVLPRNIVPNYIFSTYFASAVVEQDISRAKFLGYNALGHDVQDIGHREVESPDVEGWNFDSGNKIPGYEKTSCQWISCKSYQL